MEDGKLPQSGEEVPEVGKWWIRLEDGWDSTIQDEQLLNGRGVEQLQVPGKEVEPLKEFVPSTLGQYLEGFHLVSL